MVQELADTHKNRAFLAATKMVYGPSTHGPTPLRTSTNELVKDPESINFVLLLARFYIWLCRSKRNIPTIENFKPLLEQYNIEIEPFPL